MDIAQLFARAWNGVTVDQYARKKSFSPLLFGDDGNAKWDESAHPRVAKGSTEAHGGQFTKKESGATATAEQPAVPAGLDPVYYRLGLKDASLGGGGFHNPKNRNLVPGTLPYKSYMAAKPGIAMPEKPTNEQAKPGDQMGLFGEADRAKKPAFKPIIGPKGKQQSLFDTSGHKDQMLMFDDGVTPEDRLLKSEPKKLEDMTAEELATHIASQPKGGFATQFQEDWGSNRGQGKRMGGMVRGAMADPPKGIKTYTNQFGKLPEDEQKEANGLESHLGGHYAQARNAGLSHDNAMVWAYEKNGEVEPGFTHARMKNPPKAVAKAEAKPEPEAEPKASTAKAVSVGEFREQVSALGDQIRSVQSAANQKERASELDHLKRKLDQVKGMTSNRASDHDKQMHKSLTERAQAMIDNKEGGKTLPKDENEQLEKARANPARLDPILLKALGKKTDEQGPKDGDVDANGLVFRNGRWHREDSEAKPVEPASSTAPIPLRERAAFADNLAKQGKSEQEIEEAMRARSIAISDAKRHAARAFAAYGAKPSKPASSLPEGWSESSPGGLATDGNGNIVDQEFKSKKWFVIHDGPTLDGFDTRDEAFEALKNYKPEARKPEPPKEPEPVEEPLPEQKPTIEFDKAIDSGKTVREAATVAQKQLDADYEFARASTVRNAGEDLKGSARHKVNQWRGLAEAEKDGTAAEMMTRKGIAKVEPHNLMATISDTHAMSHLVAYGALSGFPDSPGSYPARYSAYKDRWGNPLPEPKSPEELRKQYHAAYMAIKNTAEKLATTEVDPRKVSRGVADEIKRQILICRGLAPDAAGMALTEAKDPYNPVANGLVSLHNRAAGSGRKKTDLMNRVLEVAKHAQVKYGAAPSRDHLAMIKEHALDLMDGKSMNKTFGLESKAVKRFDPSEAYVKHATRKGGRDLAAVTSDANKATKHMVETMGLRGVQWGNSVSDDERKHHAAKAVEALTDLADITGLHPKDIALDGKLGLAIGARGKGNASAHYEPGTKVINLTRASGVGALAHEWGHAFDHMLNDYTTNKNFNYMSNNYDRGTDKAEIRAAYKKWWDASEKYRTRLRGYLQDQMREGGMSAKKANEYWNSSHEIFARTFERHVQHKLESNDKKNTYLAGLGGNHPLWPSSEESASMADSFDGILSAYRKHKYGSTEKVKFSAREAMEAFAPQVTRYRFKPLILAQ